MQIVGFSHDVAQMALKQSLIIDVNLFSGHARPIRSLCFSPDSQLLVTGSDDHQIKIYDV